MTFPRINQQHEFISVDFGNARRLTVSYGGAKASGKVPHEVFDLWAKATMKFDAAALMTLGLNAEDKPKLMTVIEKFVEKVDSLWPTWNVAPKVPTIGQEVTYDFGPRRGGVDKGTVTALKRTSAVIRFERMGAISMAVDMLAL